MNSSTSLINRGYLLITNYRLIYREYHKKLASNTEEKKLLNITQADIDIPLAYIQDLILYQTGHCLGILTKDLKWCIFSIPNLSDKQMKQYYYEFKNIIFTSNIFDLFMFQFRLSNSITKDYGWFIYDEIAEYQRLGLTNSQYFSIISNKKGHICPSYPNYLVLPNILTKEEIYDVCEFRSKRRIPVVIYKHPETHAILSRSSQPLTGLHRKRNYSDENLLNLLRLSSVYFQLHQTSNENDAADEDSNEASNEDVDNSNSADEHSFNPYLMMDENESKWFNILDARPLKTIIGHSLVGAGFEYVNFYHSTRLEYLNIDSHLKKTFKNLCNIIHHPKFAKKISTFAAADDDENEHQNKASQNKASQNKEATLAEENNEREYYLQLESTGYFHFIRLYLSGMIRIIELLSAGESCLIHCSDGWDRTPTLSSLAQLCLDPYYRTIKGFIILIEKEWLAFGHKFADRNGMINIDVFGNVSDQQQKVNKNVHQQHDKEEQPVFLMFLECVYQLLLAYPANFQFNKQLLFDILKGLYSGKYGTFLCNSKLERQYLKLATRTRSIWTSILHDQKSMLIHIIIQLIWR